MYTFCWRQGPREVPAWRQTSGKIMVDQVVRGKRIVGRAALARSLLLLDPLVLTWEHGTAAGKTSLSVSYPHEISRITFAAAGDIIPHQSVVKAAAAHEQTAKDAPPARSPESKDASTAAPPPAEGNHGGGGGLFAGGAGVFRPAGFRFFHFCNPLRPASFPGSKPRPLGASRSLLLS